MTCIEWVLRWIVVPAKVIPFAIASAQYGWRLPVRRVLQLLWNWRWWLGATICRAGECVTAGPLLLRLAAWNGHSRRKWRVALKLAASYLLGIGGWLLLLAWAGVLFGSQKPLPESGRSDGVVTPTKREPPLDWDAIRLDGALHGCISNSDSCP